MCYVFIGEFFHLLGLSSVLHSFVVLFLFLLVSLFLYKFLLVLVSHKVIKLLFIEVFDHGIGTNLASNSGTGINHLITTW